MFSVTNQPLPRPVNSDDTSSSKALFNFPKNSLANLLMQNRGRTVVFGQGGGSDVFSANALAILFRKYGCEVLASGTWGHRKRLLATDDELNELSKELFYEVDPYYE